MTNGPHHTVLALDILAYALIPLCLYGLWYIVRECRRLCALARKPAMAAPERAALEDIPEAQLVHTPITSARKEITG